MANEEQTEKSEPGSEEKGNPELMASLRKVRLRPIGKQVLVRRLPRPKKIGLIHIPDAWEGRPLPKGEVLAVGRDVTEVSVGEVVCWGTYGGSEEGKHGEGLVFVREDEIMYVEEK